MKILGYYRWYPDGPENPAQSEEIEITYLRFSPTEGAPESADYVFVWDPFTTTEIISRPGVIRLTPSPGDSGKFKEFKFWISNKSPEALWCRVFYYLSNSLNLDLVFDPATFEEVPLLTPPEEPNWAVMNDAEEMVIEGQEGEHHTKYLHLMLVITKPEDSDAPPRGAPFSLVLNFQWKTEL